MEITRAKQIDDKGNVRYVITGDGLHLGDVYKTGSGKYRPELADGSYGPTGSITAGIEWLKTYAKPSADEIREQIRTMQWHLETEIPKRLATTTHAREIAGLKRLRGEFEQQLGRLVARLSETVQADNQGNLTPDQADAVSAVLRGRIEADGTWKVAPAIRKGGRK